MKIGTCREASRLSRRRNHVHLLEVSDGEDGEDGGSTKNRSRRRGNRRYRRRDCPWRRKVGFGIVENEQGTCRDGE